MEAIFALFGIFVAFVVIMLFSLFIRWISSLIFPSHLTHEVEELTRRVSQLEKKLSSLHAELKPSKVDEAPVLKEEVPAPIASITPTPTPVVEPVAEESVPVASPAVVAPEDVLKQQVPIDTDALERYVGQRLIGWAAVALAIFAIGFFIKYAYDKGWIIPEGRVAIGELIGIGLITAGWRQHRKGNALGSQMLLGCGIGACYLATYAAFGFYDLISQPTAGVCMSIVMLMAGCLAVVTNAFSLGMLTILGGLLTPLLLQSTIDQHVSLFMYLAMLVASIYAVYLWKPWPALRSLVWVGALIHFNLWYGTYYNINARPACYLFLGLLGFISAVQILWYNRRRNTTQEDWILFLITPLVIFAIVCFLMRPDQQQYRGKLAIALTLFYGGISYFTWRGRQHDYSQFQLPLAVSLICMSVAIPLELGVGWIGIGWLTQGVLLWAAGLWRHERLVQLFGIGTLVIGTLRIFVHDVYLHQPVSAVPFLNATALPGLWLSASWAIASGLAFHFKDRLANNPKVGIAFTIATVWLFWIVFNIEVYPYFKTWDWTPRWLGVVWMAMAIAFYWWGCQRGYLEWRLSALLMISFSVFRSLLPDLPVRRSEAFIPLLDQQSLPVLFTAALLLALRPILIRYETTFHPDEKQFKPITGLTALAMIWLMLSLDTYQFCVVQYPAQELLPHAVLSVVWSLYGALLLAIGFWKHLSTLRWSAIGIFGLTLAKVLLIDLGWLSGLYRIMALLLIALVLAAVTWTYQRRK